MKTTYLIVNFGGPRHLGEIEEFLIELLTDQEVLRTRLPGWIHRLLFTRVAKKRSKKIAPDYVLIGGKSPIYEDTEAIAEQVGDILGEKVIVFHRYLPNTHDDFIQKMENLGSATEVRVFPLFPQFSTATTGSIALWFSKHLPKTIVGKFSWIKSYPGHPLFIQAFEQLIRDFLNKSQLHEEEVAFLFSPHGVPQKFVDTGDCYEKECTTSFELLKGRFPKAVSKLSYQSQFGREEWIRPFTADVCEKPNEWVQARKNVVIVPLSFTSDHIETLYEVEHLYLPLIRKTGVQAYRCPALNRREDWIRSIAQIFEEGQGVANSQLIRTE